MMLFLKPGIRLDLRDCGRMQGPAAAAGARAKGTLREEAPGRVAANGRPGGSISARLQAVHSRLTTIGWSCSKRNRLIRSTFWASSGSLEYSISTNLFLKSLT